MEPDIRPSPPAPRMLRTGPTWRAGLLAALVAVALLAASCASPGGDAGQGSGDSALQQLLAYSRCMRSHGISDYPDPQRNPGGPGGSISYRGDPHTPQFQAANKACQSLLPQPTGSPRAHVAAALKLARCMRSHGFPTFPDPNGQGAFERSQLQENNPRFLAAMKTCRTLTHFSGAIPVY